MGRAQRLIVVSKPAIFETKLRTVAFRSPFTPMEQELSSQLKLCKVVSSPSLLPWKEHYLPRLQPELAVCGDCRRECNRGMLQSSMRTGILAKHSKQNRGSRVICGRSADLALLAVVVKMRFEASSLKFRG